MIMTCALMCMDTMMIQMSLTFILTETHKNQQTQNIQINNGFINFISAKNNMRKINFQPITNRTQLPDLPQLSSQRAIYEYLAQLEKWEEIRQKMKSMQLNKIQVTSYINKDKRKVSSSCEMLNDISHSQKRKSPEFQFQNRYKNIHPIDIFGSNNIPTKIFRSQNGPRPSIKRTNLLTPYMANAYKLQINKRKINQISSSNNINNQKVQNPQHNQQPSEAKSKKDDKQMVPGYNIIPVLIQNKIKKRQKNLNKSKTQSNNSVYSKRKVIPPNINNRQTSHTNSDLNDFVEFCKVSSKDITERVIIRRKSNINHTDGTIEAIQASILKKKIILFTVDVTSGNANEFTDAEIKSPFNLANQFQVAYPIPAQKQVKVITHTPTRTYQMKLLLGTKQILQYLQQFGFSQHPLQLYNSIEKLAIILVDLLKITSSGLKIDKSELVMNIKSNRQEKKQFLQQKCKKLQNSELIRWKNQNHKKKNQLDKIKNLNKTAQYHKQYPETQFYKAYGHPHPVINGRQYQNIIQYEHDHPLQKIEQNISKQIEKKNKQTIEQKNKKQINLNDEYIEEITIQKTISQKDSISKIPQQQLIISNQVIKQKISLQKNNNKSIENIEQNVPSQKTLSMVDEVIQNQSQINHQNTLKVDQ